MIEIGLKKILKRVASIGAGLFIFTCLFFCYYLPSVNAATEFTSIIDPGNAAGTDYTSLSAWEAAIQSDLTSSSTLVFSYATSTRSGNIPDNSVVVGETSGATGTLVHLTGTTSPATAQLLVRVASGTFQSGEKLYLQSDNTKYIYLSDSGNPAIAVAKCRSTNGAADTTAVEINGWTTSSSNYVKIWTDPTDYFGRHQGKWDEGKYRLKSTTDSGIVISVPYTVLEGLQLMITKSDYDPYVLRNDGSGGNSVVKDNVIVTNFSGSANGLAVLARANSIYVNNIIFGIGSVLGGGISVNNNATVTTINNSIYNFSGAFRVAWGGMVATNNMAQNCTNYCYASSSSFSLSYNNLSSDNTAPGTNSKTNVTVKFVDAANQDFRLSPDDTSARDAGTSTPLAAVTSSMYDIQGTLRGNAWDIGADEVPVDFVSTVCQSKSAGASCSEMDYQSLSQWEDKVEADIAATSTRIFSGSITGTLNENDLVYILTNSVSVGSARIVATTSDQIMIDGIISSTSLPIISVASGTLIRKDTSNYWTVRGATTADALGASAAAIAKIDGSWTAVESLSLIILGWTTDYDNGINIYTTGNARHGGVAGSGYISSSSDQNIRIRESNVRVDGLQITGTKNATGKPALSIGEWDDVYNVVLTNNIIHDVYYDYTTSGIEPASSVAGAQRLDEISINNNIIYNIDGAGMRNNISVLNYSALIYNNTIYNCNLSNSIWRGGIASFSDVSKVKIYNNIAFNNRNIDYYNSNVSANGSSYNASSDTSGNVGFRSMQAASHFVSIASTSIDLHLVPASSLVNAGINVSATTSNALTTDIDGAMRNPDGLGWDIGADEIPVKIYRSISPSATAALTTGASNAVTISSTTRLATFTTALADNIGVGDVIVYNSSANIAFISGRSSSTVYTVLTASGTAPIAASADTSWSLYRAYTSLSNAEAGIENAGITSGLRNFDDWTPGGTAATDDIGANLVSTSSNYQWNIAAYGNGTTADTARTTVDGWTSAKQNFVRIFTPVFATEVGTSQRHSGKWDDGKYNIKFTAASSWQRVVYLADDYAQADGLQIKLMFSYSNSYAVDLGGLVGVNFSNNMIWGFTQLPNLSSYGIAGSSSRKGKIYNNVVYGFRDSNNSSGYGILFGNAYNNPDDASIYNNTVYDSYNCFKDSAGSSVYLKNNIAQNCTDGFNGFKDSYSVNNISDLPSDAPGTDSKNSTTVKFVDAANKDFHLAQDDTAARGAGANLSDDAVFVGTQDLAYLRNDIDGQLRNATGTGWDIGADEGTVEFTPTVKQSGGDYSTLSSWEAGIQTDLVASSTRVFGYSGLLYGTMADDANVTGTTSGATARIVHVSTSSNQILLENIVGTFLSGETVQVSAGNYVILSDNGNPASAVAKIDGAWTAADTVSVTVDGWTSGADNYIKIYTTPSARHLGKWSEDKYRLAPSSGQDLVLFENYARVDGLQAESGTSNGIYSSSVINVSISNNIVRKNNVSSDVNGIYVAGVTSGNKIWNNIVYGFAGTGNRGINIWAGSVNSPHYVNNNTVYGNTLGIYSNNVINVSVANNNISSGNGSDYSIVFTISSSNNISSDNTAPGTNSKSSTTVRFMDAANQDFRLHPDDTAARDAGTSTPFLTDSNTMYDIQGTLRGSAWDIGADEVPVDFVSTICENKSAGGACSELDYQSLYQWEDKVEADLTATSTRIFSGSITGTLNENDTVYIFNGDVATSSGRAYIVATTSDQIMIDGIISSTSLPIISVASGTIIKKDASNYWTVRGATTTDALGASPVAVAMIDGVWVNAENRYLYINHWMDDEDNSIRIYTTSFSRHSGKWDNNKYRIDIEADAAYRAALAIYQEHVVIDGVQINIDNTANYFLVSAIAYNYLGNNDEYLLNSILKSRTPGKNSAGISTEDSSGAAPVNLYVNNVIAYNFQYGLYKGSTGGSVSVYNSTFYNLWNIGIYANILLLNSLIASTSDPYNGTFHASSTNNATDKNDTPSGSTGTNYINQTFSFVSTASGTEDFHLLDTDTGARNKGVNLSTNGIASLSLAMTQGGWTDVDGAMRDPDGLGWDIGADEVPVKIYRSISPSATAALTTGASNAVTISSTTRLATFTTALADNIGVGDVIVYNSSANIAFISGRTSSQIYTLQTASGTAPISASADTSWSIYRAYTTLANAEAGIENTGITSALRNFDDWTPGGTAATSDIGTNLVSTTSNYQWNIAAYGNGTTADTVGVTVAGWATGEQNILRIYTPTVNTEVGSSQRHSGKWDGAKYNLNVVGAVGIKINSLLSYVDIDGLQVMVADNGSDYIAGLSTGNVDSTRSKINISNNILAGAPNYKPIYGINQYARYDLRVWNNIAYGFTNGTGFDLGYGGVGTYYCYNNTSNGNYVGFYARSNGVFKNNLASNNIHGGYLGSSYFSGSTNNLSSDATADDDTDMANAKINQTVRFVDAANKDFHLAQDDTAARGAGANLSNDAAFVGTQDLAYLRNDIDGQMRNATGTGWDIGADEGTVEAVATVMQTGGDYSTLSSWEAGMQTDLTATTTRVFSYSSRSGSIADNATVVGQTSNATGTVVHVSASSTQILLENIAGTFFSGETVQVSAGNYVILSDYGNPASAVAKIDGGWTAADTAVVTIDGWNTGADNYIKVYTTPSARHLGKWDDNKYISLSVGSKVGNLIIDGLQILFGSDSDTIRSGIIVQYANPSFLHISNNIIRGDKNKVYRYSGFREYSVGKYNQKINIYNNIIYDTKDFGINFSAYTPGGAIEKAYVYNNVVYGYTGSGIRTRSADGRIILAHNNILQNGPDGYAGECDSSSSNNISDLESDVPGSNPKNLTTVRFVSTASGTEDFHLAETDTAARDAGTSSPLFSSSQTAYDIEGQPRFDVAWDIGADEAPTRIYRSVGYDSRNLNTVAATVTVATATPTATFSADMPANIGVGDIIQYGNPLALAVISGRISSTTYSVQSPYGSMPTATTTASASIYRAHLHLDDWEDQVQGDVNQSISAALQPQVLVNQDLVASNTIMMVPLYASSTADDLALDISGWTAASTSYIRIYAPVAASEAGTSQRHGGIWNDSAYRLATTDTAISVAATSTIIEGLQIGIAPAADNRYAINHLSAPGLRISACIIRQENAYQLCTGLKTVAPSLADNNLFYGFSAMAIEASASSQQEIINNTLYGNATAIGGGAGLIAVNNAVFGNTDDFSGSFALLDHNASDDGDGSNAVSLGASPARWQEIFSDYQNYDFSIPNMHSPLYEAGISVTGISSDIIGTPRPTHDSFDIGAFEFVQVRPAYRFSPRGSFKFEGDFIFR